MKKESYKILAEHLADKGGLSIEFIDNACPSTNGQRIILPTEVNEECIDALLGALLHETAHVKHTHDLQKVMGRLGPLTKNCFNVLEDIRVDYLTNLQYPNSLDFIQELAKRVINKKGEQLRKEPIEVQALKALCLKADGFDIEKIYDDPQTLQLFKNLEKYIDLARKSKSSWDTADLARRLLIELIGQDEADKQRLNKEADRARSNTEKMNEADKKYKELTARLSESTEELNRKYKILKKEKMLSRRIQSEANREENCESIGSKERAENLRKRFEQKKKTVELLDQDYKQAHDEYSKQYEERNNSAYDYEKALEEKNKADDIIQEAVTGQQPGQGISLNGFEAMSAEELKPDYTVALNPKSIETIIMEALISKKEQDITDEQGSRLNNDCLAEYETCPEKIFTTKEQKHDLTKVAFVLDVSGSMGTFSEDKSRLNLAFKALDVLLRAVKTALDQGAPCNVALYVFGSECLRVFEGLENYATENTKKLINEKRYRVGSSTLLLEAVNKVNTDLVNEAEHRAMIVITDGAVEDSDCTAIVNKTSGDCKQIFISIGNKYYQGPRLELFGQNNILDEKSAMQVLGQALYGAL